MLFIFYLNELEYLTKDYPVLALSNLGSEYVISLKDLKYVCG